MEQYDLKDILRSKGLKLTNQRKLVLDALEKCQGQHLTAEEVWDLVKIQYPEIGLATVYRTIQLFLELNLVDKINLDDGFVRYEIVKKYQSGHRHHHLICVGCGKVYSFEEDLLEDFEAHIMKTMGFEVIDHEVKVYGHCKDCISKS